MTVSAEAAMRAARYPELHLRNPASSEVDEALRRHRRHRIRPKKGRSRVKGKFAWVVGGGGLGLSVLLPPAHSVEDGAATHKPGIINRPYPGPDGQTQYEGTEAQCHRSCVARAE